MTIPFEEIMKQYRDTYWTLKQGDGVWAIVNHNVYLKEKKGSDNGKPLVTITPYSLDGSLYQLMMINGSVGKWNNIIKAIGEKNMLTQSTEEGGFYIFHKNLLPVVAKAAKMKLKTKMELSEEKRQEMSERMKAMVAAKKASQQ